jgi:hypothetical protein
MIILGCHWLIRWVLLTTVHYNYGLHLWKTTMLNFWMIGLLLLDFHKISIADFHSETLTSYLWTHWLNFTLTFDLGLRLLLMVLLLRLIYMRLLNNDRLFSTQKIRPYDIMLSHTQTTTSFSCRNSIAMLTLASLWLTWNSSWISIIGLIRLISLCWIVKIVKHQIQGLFGLFLQVLNYSSIFLDFEFYSMIRTISVFDGSWLIKFVWAQC